MTRGEQEFKILLDIESEITYADNSLKAVARELAETTGNTISMDLNESKEYCTRA